MRNIFLPGLVLLFAILGALPSCTLDKEPDIPTGFTNETSSAFLETKLTRFAEDGVTAWAMLKQRGNLKILQHGWVWSEYELPTMQDSVIELGILTRDSFESPIAGLSTGKLYHIRPFVITGSGETFGLDETLVLTPTFKKRFGNIDHNERGYSIQKTSDGGFILLGSSKEIDESSEIVYLVKTNAMGELQWERTFGGTGYKAGVSVQQTSDDGFILFGTLSIANKSDMSLIKTNAMGELQWEKIIGGVGNQNGTIVQQTPDGGFVLLGSNDLSGSYDMSLIKTDAFGEPKWEKSFGGFGNEYGNALKQTPDGGFILLGTSDGNGYDMYLVKTNSLGEKQWEKNIGGAENQYGNDFQQTPDGGFVLLGSTIINGLEHMYLVKTNAAGELQWEKSFGHDGFERGNSILHTTDGGFVLLGGVGNPGADGYDMYLVKTTNAGELQWERNYREAGDQYGYSACQTIDGGFLLLGIYVGINVGQEMYLVKTDENGNAY